MTSCPIVTGVSPSFAFAGSKITIRGENLGESQDDLAEIEICGVDCVKWAEWISSSKIICQTGNGSGVGKIKIVTLSGGEGQCNVEFTLKGMDNIDTLTESDVWVDEVLEDEEDAASCRTKSIEKRRKDGDPLGLSRIAGRGKQIPQEELDRIFPGASSDIKSNNFVALRYLLEKHSNTSFEDLNVGLKNLRNEIQSKKIAPTIFIKENLSAYLLGEQSLQDLKKMMMHVDSQSEGGSITDKLESLLNSADKTSNSLFNEVLKRKEEADATRNALNVLDRFRFLFSIPKSLKQNIKANEIEMVVADYERTKSLFTGKETDVFKNVQDEVYRMVAEYRNELYSRLKMLPANLDDQKRLIKYLIQLDYGGDPGWESLTFMYTWVLGLMGRIRDRYQVDGIGPLPLSIKLNDSKVTQQTKHHHTPGWKRETEARLPKRVGMTEELCDLIIEVIPDMWSLAKAYLSSDLLQGVTNEEVKQAFSSGGRERECNNMITHIFTVLCQLIDGAFFYDPEADWAKINRETIGMWPNSRKDEPLEEWMPYCVRQFRNCFQTLQALSLPNETLEVCVKMISRLRILTVESLYGRAINDTKLLHERENWALQSEDHGCISSLPVLFESLVIETMSSLKDIVLDNSYEESTGLLKTGSNMIATILMQLVECFKYLVFEQEADLHTKDLQGMAHDSSSEEDAISVYSTSKDMLPSNRDNIYFADENKTPGSDERPLIILSNIYYVQNEVLPSILECYKSHSYPDPRSLEQSISHSFKELHEQIFKEYIRCKSETLMEILRKGMDKNYFDWEECIYPNKVRGYINEISLLFVEVHAETYAISSQLLRDVIVNLLEATSYQMLEMLKGIDTFCHEGALHAELEITIIEDVFNNYLTLKSCNYFSLSHKYLGLEVGREDLRAIRQLKEDFKSKNKLQLLCFYSAQ